MRRGVTPLIVALCVVAILGFGLIAGVDLSAAPLPPELVVNHETKECAEFFGGDECMSCTVPEGWEILGYVGEVECPAGYAYIEHLEFECRPFKDEFCCSEGHSGVHGDCEDLVVDRGRKLCAFVDDIDTAQLPAGWEKRPEHLSPDQWYCPQDYAWMAQPDEAPDQGGRSRGLGLPCLGAVLMAPAAVVVLLVTERRS
jgi:hypothetical protein